MTVAAPERRKATHKKAAHRPTSATVTTTRPLPTQGAPGAEEGSSLLSRRRQWTVAEFECMIDRAVFGPDERLELIEGEIIRKMTQNEPHSWAIRAVQEALRQAFPTGHDVRPQLPLVLGRRSRPEPDIAVVTGSFNDYKRRQPTTAVLVVEISVSTLRDDRIAKAALHAHAGIQEYWIVNIPDRVLEVYREPAPMTGQPLGHGYGSIRRYSGGESVTPLAAPGNPVAVADLLP